MKEKKPDQSQVDKLRRRAEERLESKNHLAAEISPSEAKKLIHELRVHQIELEMQNDELRQAQEIIEKSHSRYIDLYDFAPIGYLSLDRLGFIKEANLTAARQLQVERTRLIDSHFTQFLFSDDRKAFRRHLSLVLEGEERQAIELRLKIRDGAELFALLESACYRDITGIKLCRTAFTDITWRRRTEVALQESEEFYRSAHDELEERVEERTEDLRRTVEQLQWEIEERRRAEEALTESEQRLRYLATQLLSAQERERQRISMELHDGLGQSLMVLKMQIGAVKRNLPSELKGARDGCSDAVDTLNSIIDDIHRISHNLSASILEDMDLSAALKKLFEEFSMGHEIECSVNFDDIANLFSPETELIIYRIFQEALTNIGKYAQASKVITTIKKSDKGIHFSVKDNGNGFDIEHVLAGTATRRGIGLGSMEERVRMINGTYHLWSEVGKGTKISFILPINISKSIEAANQ